MNRLWLGKRLVELDACPSTSDEACRLAESGAEHGTVVVARSQSGGRGRLGRSWHSPVGAGLYMSCILRLPMKAEALPPVTLAAGVAVCETARSFHVPARLKWPNDVVVPIDHAPAEVRAMGGQKLAGILTEMHSRGGKVEYAVLGIGLNVGDMHPPPELASRITSLSQWSGPSDPSEVVDMLLDRLERRLDQFAAGDLATIRDEWHAMSAMADARVEICGGAKTITGAVRGLTRSGGLDVVTDDGQSIEVVSGEVHILDPGEPHE